MKLRKCDRGRLRSILTKLEITRAYLMRKDTLVCKTKSVKTTTLDFTNDQGECCVSVAKEYGSELANLFTAIHDLTTALIEPEASTGMARITT